MWLSESGCGHRCGHVLCREAIEQIQDEGSRGLERIQTQEEDVYLDLTLALRWVWSPHPPTQPNYACYYILQLI